MRTDIRLLLDYADDEFDGASFNGPSLMKTLDGLSAEAAADRNTFEGYSAWDVALHCLFYKYFTAREFGKAGPLEPYPYEEGNFAERGPTDEGSWAALRAYMRKAHAVCRDAIARATDDELAELVPSWKVSRGKAAAWLAGHDTYHTAQIRSMGVPGIREPWKR